jgi:hypothetical protein
VGVAAQHVGWDCMRECVAGDTHASQQAALQQLTSRGTAAPNATGAATPQQGMLQSPVVGSWTVMLCVDAMQHSTGSACVNVLLEMCRTHLVEVYDDLECGLGHHLQA